MRVFRNFKTALTLAAILALTLLGSGCDYLKKVLAKDKINQGSILYNQGRLREAQQFFKEATEMDPNNSVGWLYYGATLVKDYKVKSGPEREQAANQALDVYKKALDLSANNCKNQDNAISYIATIYDDLENKDENRNWLLKRAEGECATKEIKATTYYSIAVKYWTCSYDQTTRYQDKTKSATEPFHYRNMDYPAAQQDKTNAEGCITKGLEYIEKALQVDPDYVDAMFYKGLLYRERQKLTKEEPKRKEFDSIAQKIADEATALQK
jgi:tetratricopeptide (TPR) repeat protein